MEKITLEARDFDLIQNCGKARHYQPGELVFSEEDPADSVYFIESGCVSIFLHEFTNRVEIGQRESGEFFGEMAVMNHGKRAASASTVTDTKLLILDKVNFKKLLASDGAVSKKVNQVIKQRTDELIVKENLLAATGIKDNHLQISIKGDPSLRESAFMRERYESPTDKVLPELVPMLKLLMLERCVSEVFLQFNSGEIRLTNILDPFNYTIHPANKLIDINYLDRHFPVMDYEVKTNLIRRLYDTLASESTQLDLPQPTRDLYNHQYQSWQPLEPEEIVKVFDKLEMLRSIPDFYLRNMGISITRDAVRMQFNCDGTHIISTKDYTKFLEENVGTPCEM